MAGCAAGAALGLISGVTQTVAGVGAVGANAVHGDDMHDRQGDESGKPCDDLKASAPPVIELRTAGSNPLSFRLVSLVAPRKKTPYWKPESDWQSGDKLAQMGFNPPLESVLPQGSRAFIVYAPSEPNDQREQDQLGSLMAAFGADIGTFHANGTVYDFTVVPQLPCFPPPQ